MKAEETGGLLAAVTGDPAAGAFRLSLAGNAPLDDWKGDLAIEAEGLARADAAIGLALAEPLRLTLAGDDPAGRGHAAGRHRRDRRRPHRPGRRAHADGAAAGRDRSPAASPRPAAELSADGRADLDSEDFRAGATLTVADLGALDGLAGETLAGNLRIELAADGKLQQPQANLRLEGGGLGFGAITAERLSTSLDMVAREPLDGGLTGLQITGGGAIEGLHLPQAEPLPLDRLDWQIDVAARAEDAVDLNLLRLTAADLAVVEVRGEVDPQTLAAAGQVGLAVDSLARLAGPFGQPVDGTLRLHADVVATEQARQIDTLLKGALDRLAGLPPGAAELLGSKVEIATTAQVRPDSELRIADLSRHGRRREPRRHPRARLAG